MDYGTLYLRINDILKEKGISKNRIFKENYQRTLIATLTGWQLVIQFLYHQKLLEYSPSNVCIS